MRFAGKELDPESALMNFEARYYRNTWGRFTQVDPVSGSLTDPQSWNRYAYARNSPLTFVDPSGREPFRVIIWGHQKIGDGCNDIDGTEWCNSGGGILGACADILSLSCDIALAPPLRQLPNPIGIRFPKPMPSHGKDGDNNGGGDGNHTDGSDGGNNNHHDPDPNKPCDSPPAPPGVDLDRNISAAKTVSAQGGALGWPWLKYMWFAEMSDTGGPFDFKKGGHQEFQDYGNWHYGVLGAALHIPENVLFRAAGYVQWRNRGPNYDPAWGVPWGSAPYGDDPERDVPWIATGYNYYKSCKN
jgi:RHS repeat-associated protein